ncbi:MAG: hypothetical protein QF682_08480 [Candidatus Thermoplasmatota archaeon]|nr:hypothetical protein [Candidatus Thermoplasmatota archaeon]
MKKMTQKSGIVIFFPVVTIASCNSLECYKWFGKIGCTGQMVRGITINKKIDAGSLGFHGEGKHCKL